jgi:hypothetical protein
MTGLLLGGIVYYWLLLQRNWGQSIFFHFLALFEGGEGLFDSGAK